MAIESVHIVVGGAIGLGIAEHVHLGEWDPVKPAIGFVAGTVSHWLVDVVRHFDSQHTLSESEFRAVMTDQPKGRRWNRAWWTKLPAMPDLPEKAKGFIKIDLAAGALLGLMILFRYPDHWWTIGWTMFGSVLPDGVLFGKIYEKCRSSRFFQIYYLPHYCAHAGVMCDSGIKVAYAWRWLGLVWQILVLVIGGWWLLRP